MADLLADLLDFFWTRSFQLEGRDKSGDFFLGMN